MQVLQYIQWLKWQKLTIHLSYSIQLAKALDTTVDTLLYDVTPATTYKYDRDAKILLEDCTATEREYLLELLKVAKECIRKL